MRVLLSCGVDIMRFPVGWLDWLVTLDFGDLVLVLVVSDVCGTVYLGSDAVIWFDLGCV